MFIITFRYAHITTDGQLYVFGLEYKALLIQPQATAVGSFEIASTVHAQVLALVDVDDDLLPDNSHRVEKLLVDGINQVLNAVGGQAFANGESGVDYHVGKVDVQSAHSGLII